MRPAASTAKLQGMRTSRAAFLNSTVLGIGCASLFSDWSHEIASTLMPAYVASLGLSAFWLGAIEGCADGISCAARLLSGHYTDSLARRKPLAVMGYVLTAAGTAATGLAHTGWQLLAARSSAWLGRGVRTPARKALLAAAVTPETYGRAVGFERMMDTVGAIAGPLTVILLLSLPGFGQSRILAWTLLPGMAAALCMALLVRERPRQAAPPRGIIAGMRGLPAGFRRLLLAVAVFGLGDFAHTMLILLAAQALAPRLGATGAAGAAAALYVMHNVVYALGSMGAGYLADHTDRRVLLAAGYALAAAMALLLACAPHTLPVLAAAFFLAGLFVAVEEPVTDAWSATLVPAQRHGTAYGTLAAVAGAGDLLSSVVVGALWATCGTTVAFGYSAICFVGAGILALRVKE
jgi:MFS family permease